MPTAGAVGRRVTSWAMSVPTELVPEIRAAHPQADRLTSRCRGPGHAGGSWSCEIGHCGRCVELSGRSLLAGG